MHEPPKEFNPEKPEPDLDQTRKLWPSQDSSCSLNRAQRRHPAKYGIPGPGVRGGLVRK